MIATAGNTQSESMGRDGLPTGMPRSGRAAAIFGATVLLTTILAACSDLGDPIDERGPDPDPVPVILSLDPDSGSVGDTFLVIGQDFGSVIGSLELGEIAADIVAWSDTSIRVIVPEDGVSATVQVGNSAGFSNRVSFRVIGTPDPLPELAELVPVRTVVGDTLRILGSEFGSEAGARRVVFAGTGGTNVDGSILSWENDEISVLVPTGAVAGGVALAEGARRSNELPFSVAPALVLFTRDVRSVFNRQGCTSCHGGTNNLFLDTPAQVLRGGDHGSGVVPRRASESLIVRVLRGPVGDISRMPDGSGQIPDADIRVIEDWVNQGAREN